MSDDGVWQKTEAAASTAGGVGLGVMKDIAIAYVKQELSTRLELSLRPRPHRRCAPLNNYIFVVILLR